jgi:glycosyltransferase involved in cell wall biosynthesis
VQVVGRVENAAKYTLLAGADAVLLPSRFETFGIVAIEAAAAGAPVIAFDIGPMRELVGSIVTGRLVPAFDAHAFAEAALAFEGRPPAQAEAVRRVRQRYAWDAVAEAQEGCYRAAVSAGGRQ